MGAVWGPADDMITKVIEGKSEPAAAVAEACSLINAANKKEPSAGGAAAPAMSEMPKASGTVTLWHGWTGAEADKLAEVVTAFQAKAPDVTVDVLAVTFDQLKNKFTTRSLDRRRPGPADRPQGLDRRTGAGRIDPAARRHG